MDLAEAAMLARIKGDVERAAQLTRQAFVLERKAAESCANDPTYEPTRSVLHRSAATLALRCQEYREAERLIAVALSGDPPAEIAAELRDLLEQVYLERHRSLKGVSIPSPSPMLTADFEEIAPGAGDIEVSGRLKFADSTREAAGIIRLVDSQGHEHTIVVPKGMMSDIVRPLWDYDVVVRGTHSGEGILLGEIARDSRR